VVTKASLTVFNIYTLYTTAKLKISLTTLHKILDIGKTEK